MQITKNIACSHVEFLCISYNSIYLCRKNKMEEKDIKRIEELKAKIAELQERVTDLEDNRKDALSLAVVSGDMDKIMASMIIGLAAAAMDTEVKMFFSFWALSALRDPKKKVSGKKFIPKMFGMMLPKGRNKLKLSNMNMSGIGPKMIKGLMKKHNVLSLDEMFKQAGELGIEITVCEMSMDLMGFKKEEFIDYPNLRFAGAATFAAEAGESAAQLFV